MKSALTLITNFERGGAAQAFLKRSAPLLYVLRGRMRIEGSKAGHGFAEHGGAKLKPLMDGTKLSL